MAQVSERQLTVDRLADFTRDPRIVIPAIGGFIVGLMARNSSDKIRGNGI